MLELLAALTVIALLCASTIPAVSNLANGNRFSQSLYEIADALRLARASAIAKNTYVFVGFEEVDASLLPSAIPQKLRTGTSTNGGRVAIFTVASRDGTSIYDPDSDDLAESWQMAVSGGARLVEVGKLRSFDGVQLLGQPPQNGGLTRPIVNSPDDRVGSMYRPCATTFGYPLQSGTDSSRQQYTFTRVIEFDPRGCPHVIYSTNANTLVQYVEIGLGEVRSNGAGAGNVAAIQVDGLSGAVMVYQR